VLNKLQETVFIYRVPLLMTQFDKANQTRVTPLFLSHSLSWVRSSSQPASTMGLTELGPIIGADWQRKPHIKMDCHLSQTQQSWNTPGNARTGEREDEVYGKWWEQRMSWEERIREREREREGERERESRVFQWNVSGRNVL